MAGSLISSLLLLVIIIAPKATTTMMAMTDLFAFVHPHHLTNRRYKQQQRWKPHQQYEQTERMKHHNYVPQHYATKSPFQIFEECVKRRIDIADTQIPLLDNDHDNDQNDQETIENDSVNGSIGILSLEELRNLTCTDITHPLSQKQNQQMLENQKRRRKEIINTMSTCGGCLLIQLSSSYAQQRQHHHQDVRILQKMWSSINSLFEKTKLEQSIDLPFRHQILARSSSPSSLKEGEKKEKIGGYSYLETSRLRTNQSLVPSLLPNLDLCSIVGNEHDAAIYDDAYSLLLEISRLLSILVLAGGSSGSDTDDGNDIIGFDCSDLDVKVASNLIQRIGDDGTDIQFLNETDVSCTVHRLCLYASSSSSSVNAAIHNINGNDKSTEKNSDATEKEKDIRLREATKEAEYIRSHTDWSILTLVPVSSVFGLETWKNKKDGWVRPEFLARNQYEKDCRQGQTFCSNKGNEGDQWNSNYVVAMTGKWLEILSNGKIPATVHRVVVSDDDGETNKESPQDQMEQWQQRMSAPFFWRPRQRISLDIQRAFNSESSEEYSINYDDSDISFQPDDRDLHNQHINSLEKTKLEITVNMTESEKKVVKAMNQYLKTTYG